MRIIQQGSSEVVTTCTKCGTKFAYMLAELRTNYLSSCEYVNCPSCGNQCRHRPFLGRPE